MKLRHFAVFGGIFTVIICLLLFLFIVTADDEENSTSYFDFSGLNLSEEVLKHQPTVEKYAKEYGISDYVNYLLAIMQLVSVYLVPHRHSMTLRSTYRCHRRKLVTWYSFTPLIILERMSPMWESMQETTECITLATLLDMQI